MQSSSHRRKNTANEKDPSTSLGMTIREDERSFIPFHAAVGANLRPFGAPPSKGRREKTLKRECGFPHIVISSEARNLFRLRGRLSGMADNGKPDISSMCVMEVVRTVKNAGRKNFEDLSSRVLLYEIGVAVSPMVTGVSDLNTAFGHRPYICAAQPPPPSLIPNL